MFVGIKVLTQKIPESHPNFTLLAHISITLNSDKNKLKNKMK